MKREIHIMHAVHAAAALEFALVLPVLLVFLFGTIEIARLTLFNQKSMALASSMADYVSRDSTPTPDSADRYAGIVPFVTSPVTSDNGTIIISAVANNSATLVPRVIWQKRYFGGSPSRVGVPGDWPNLPFPLLFDNSYIIAEVYEPYQPILPIAQNLVPTLYPRSLYHVAYYHPRQSPPNCTDRNICPGL